MLVVRGRVAALLTLGLLLVGLAVPGLVLAHAQLEAMSPSAGSTVEGSPRVVSATFDDDLVPSKSSIEVVAPDGSTVATGGVSADDPTTLSTEVPTLAPGTYTVHWAAATADGHLERDSYAFTVAEAPSAEPTSVPTSSAAPSSSALATMPPMSMGPSTAPTAEPGATGAAASPAPSPAASPTSDASGGAESMGQIVMIAIVGLALGLGIGWWRSRRGA